MMNENHRSKASSSSSWRSVVVMNESFRVREGSWCGFGSGGFQRQIHEKENVSKLRASPDQSQDPSIISINAKRQTPFAARYAEWYVHPAIADQAKQHACQASSSSSWRGVVVMNGSFRVRDENRCGFGSGGFQRQIHEKEKVSNH